MTYEEYKNNKEVKRISIKKSLKVLFSKLFTIVIFTMIVIITSNYSPSFKNFLVNKVLNDTLDFSVVNNFVSKITSIFKVENTLPVYKEIPNIKSEKYLDGIKYIVNDNYKVTLKDSGIVTYIGEKEGYNNTVIVQQSNGYYAWYGNVLESIKLYDYVEKGNVIGTSSGEYYYVLLKDDKVVDINES